MELSASVYLATKTFPKKEMFGLTNQLRRASVSVPSNVAEGQGRLTSGELLHFLGIARGSAMEVQTQLELAKRLGLGIAKDLQHAETVADDVLRILNSAIRNLRLKIEQKNLRPKV